MDTTTLENLLKGQGGFVFAVLVGIIFYVRVLIPRQDKTLATVEKLGEQVQKNGAQVEKLADALTILVTKYMDRDHNTTSEIASEVAKMKGQ